MPKIKTAFLTILTILCSNSISANLLNLNCHVCLRYGGKQCLLNDNFRYATCCDENPNV